MIQRRDRLGFLLEARGVASLQPLDRHGAIQPRVVGLPHLAHPTGAQWRGDLIGANMSPAGSGTLWTAAAEPEVVCSSASAIAAVGSH